MKTKVAAAVVMLSALAACGGGGDGSSSGSGAGGSSGGVTSPGAAPETQLPGATPPTDASPVVPPVADPGTEVPAPEPAAKVWVDESFEGKTALPDGWSLLAANRGTVSVRDGSLFIDGRAHDTAMTSVALPASLQDLSNYRIDVNFTLLTPNNTGRWASVMYRTARVDATIPYDPYYQFAIRANATASNGTEFALRKAGAWNVTGTKAFSEAIDSAKTYTATVIVHGNRVRQYLNNTLTHDMTLDPTMAKGGIGLQTAGVVMRVDSIKVTEQLTALPDVSKVIAVQDTGTKAAMAPTLVQPVTAQTVLGTTGASNALYNIDSTLNLHSDSGESLASLATYLAQSGRATIPVLRISNAATVSALAAFAVDHDLGDVTLLSDNVELLASARAALPSVRTAVDFSRRTTLGNSTQAILEVVSATNRAKAKIAVLPAAMTDRTTVAHLQRLLLTPWAVSSATSAFDAAAVLTTGVNGVIASNAAVYASVLRQLPANTLLRKPLIAGHRGMPSTTDENTLESAQAAVAAGADAVENDIYMTTDNHLVILHNATVDATTDGTGSIESMTLAQVKALKTASGYAVPTLEEFLQAFKGKPVTHFIEIKSAKAGIVALLKQEIERWDAKDQTVAISFDGNQLNRMGATMPEVSVGLLNSNVDAGDPLVSLRNVLNATQQYSSTYNPSYATGVTQATMEAGKHRGVTFWPWTVNVPNDFYRLYSFGTHGITTDSAWWAKDFPVALTTASTAVVTRGQPFGMSGSLSTQVGASSAATSNVLVVLEGSVPHTMVSDGVVSFSAPGTATVLPGYTYKMGDGTYSYTIFGKPVSVVVQ